MNTEQTKMLFPFSFEQNNIRTFLYKGKPAFLASEIGKALGFSDAVSTIRRMKIVDEGLDYLTTSTEQLIEMGCDGVESDNLSDSRSPNRVLILFESGLYTFVLRSDKPAALEFHRWVVREVLPEARKQGFYAQVPSALQDDTNPKHLLDLINMAGKGNRWAESILQAKGMQPAPAPKTPAN